MAQPRMKLQADVTLADAQAISAAGWPFAFDCTSAAVRPSSLLVYTATLLLRDPTDRLLLFGVLPAVLLSAVQTAIQASSFCRDAAETDQPASRVALPC